MYFMRIEVYDFLISQRTCRSPPPVQVKIRFFHHFTPSFYNTEFKIIFDSTYLDVLVNLQFSARFVFYFFSPSVKKRQSRWTHNEMSSLRVKCKKKVHTSSSYFNCFSTMHKEDRSQNHSGSRYARLLRITE